METIDRDELKRQLDAGADLKLVMAMHETHFEQAHIPGSIHLFEIEDAGQHLAADDRIVVYCSDRSCQASALVGQKLIDAGYPNVVHYQGGLADWLAAGFELEGEAAQ